MRATASRSPGNRSAISSGPRRTLSRFPRRSCSQPSREVRLRIATSDVLERGPAGMVRVDVAGRDRLDAERLGEVAQREVPARVAALVRALELDEEALAAEGLRQPRRGVRVAHREAVARAAREADEPVRVLHEQRRIERWRQQLRLASERPCVRVRGGEQPAEVRVAARRLDEQGDVGAAAERDLGAGDRPDADRLRRVRELERAVDPVVVGERERLVAELGGRARASSSGCEAPSRNE